MTRIRLLFSLSAIGLMVFGTVAAEDNRLPTVFEVFSHKYAKDTPYPLLSLFNSSQIHQQLILTNADFEEADGDFEEKYFCNELFCFSFSEGDLFAHEMLAKLPWPLEDQLKDLMAEPAEEVAPIQRPLLQSKSRNLAIPSSPFFLNMPSRIQSIRI